MTERTALSAILAVVRSIPSGFVVNYGQIALRAGLPGRARMVAWALKQVDDANPVPWHRVLRSDGRIAFPQGSDAFEKQRRLLLREKVELVKGRVPRSRFAWQQNDLDAELWRPPE